MRRGSRARAHRLGAAMTGGPAFEELFGEGFPYVLLVLHRLGVPERDEEDRVQDVFFAVFQRLPTYDPARPLRPWLHGITFHVVTNHYARTWREVLMDDVEEPIDQAMDPEQATSETTDRELLIQLMQELDLDHRVVISMYIDGIEMPDVARELGIAVATAYKRLDTARRRLQVAVLRVQRDRRARGAAVVPLHLAALFAADRTIPDVPADMRARVWSRLQAATRTLPSTGNAPPVPTDSTVLSAARAAARMAARVAPYVVSAAVGAAWMYGCPDRPSRPPAPIVQAVRLSSPADPVPSALATAPPAPPSSVAGALATVTPATASAAIGARAAAEAEEESLLFRARVAHAHGDTSGALDALNEHEHKYPHGELAGDREQLRAELELEQLVDLQSAAPSAAPRAPLR
jgi:RNA polymerase sigma factor (sigma-70 family)